MNTVQGQKVKHQGQIFTSNLVEVIIMTRVTFSGSNKPEVEIWWTFSLSNAKIQCKHHQIDEILHSI